MKRLFTCLFSLGLLIVLAACGRNEGLQTADTLEQNEGLNEMRERLAAAYVAGDAGALAQLFSENGTVVPSVGQEIEGRQAIENTFRYIWEDWKISDFNLVPQEGRVVDDWAFERGTITVVAERRDAATGQRSQGQQAPDQPGSPRTEEPSGQAEPDTQTGSQPDAVMDLNHYVLVMNKVGDEWRINWFISTEPVEYSATVTAAAPETRQEQPAPAE